MKILHLTGEREDVGGILSVIRNLQSATQSTPFQHAVWVNQAFVQTRQPRLSLRTSRYACSETPNHFSIAWRSATAFFELRRLLRHERFDLVHAHNRGTLLVAVAWTAWSRRPALFTNHAYARRIGLYQKAAARPGFHTVVLTPNMARHYGFVERPPKVNVISDCFADPLLESELIERQARDTNAPLRLVGVGNVMRWKNWHLIAEAISRLSGAERSRLRLNVWGPTPQDGDSPKYERELRQRLAELGVELQIVLRGSATSITDCLRQADWFVLPSTNEPCSVALLEAMALGLPALVSASGGNIDIVSDGRTGLLFRPDDADDLAAKLRRLLRREVDLASPAEIRQSVACRSASSVARKYAELYRRIVNSASSEQVNPNQHT